MTEHRPEQLKQVDVDAFDLSGILTGLENGDFTSLELVNVRPLDRIQSLHSFRVGMIYRC